MVEFLGPDFLLKLVENLSQVKPLTRFNTELPSCYWSHGITSALQSSSDKQKFFFYING